MPSSPLRPCKHPGCGELTKDGWCPEHKPKRQRGAESEAWHEMLHVHNTCARRCFGNVRNYVDGNGNIKPLKNKSTGRIDAAVGMIIVVAVWMIARNHPKSISEQIDDGTFEM